jgi:hypothetical protein
LETLYQHKLNLPFHAGSFTFLTLSKLANLDLLSKSDPKVELSMKNNKTQQWQFIGLTETVKNNLNPNFEKKFKIKYMFEGKPKPKIQYLQKKIKNFTLKSWIQIQTLTKVKTN